MRLNWRDRGDGRQAAYSGELYVGYVKPATDGGWIWELMFTDRLARRRGVVRSETRARAQLTKTWNTWLKIANLKEAT